MDGKKNHQGKRQERRRHASYLVKQDLTTRRLMTNSEIHELYDAINENNLSKFGIIKLGSYILESSFLMNWDGLNEKTSLMKYAVTKNRDKIIAALIRGGYDPSVHPDLTNNKSIHVVTSLSSFPPGYSVWLVKFAYRMIQEAIQSLTLRSTDIETDIETNSDYNTKKCEHCNQNIGERNIVEENQILLTWGTCQHRICVNCTWKTLCHPLSECKYSLRCPICQIRCDGGSDSLYLDDLSPLSGNQQLLKDMTSLQRRVYSIHHWSQLPSDKTSSELSDEDLSSSQQKNKRPPFIVGPLYEVSKYLIGTTKEQRLVEFHRSILTNNIDRMYWIFRAGINVNEQNQYGQTGLMLSSICGHLEATSFLIWCGSDPLIVDSIRSNVYKAAHSHYHQNICEYFDHTLSNEILQQLKGDLFPSLLLPVQNLNSMIMTMIPSTLSEDPLGSCFLDHCFSNSFLEYLDSCFENCQIDSDVDSSSPLQQSCPRRSHLYDSDGIIRREISSVLSHLPSSFPCRSILPMMKYLSYTSPGSQLASHIDLSKYDPISHISSTHTLIIYLTTCTEGGETILLDHVSHPTIHIPIKPQRGRMLIFPHHCPHEGGLILQVPKILLRCEAY